MNYCVKCKLYCFDITKWEMCYFCFMGYKKDTENSI